MLANESAVCSNVTMRAQILNGLSGVRLVLLVPLSVFILYQAGFQWKQQRSFRNAAHSDVFTYNMAAMEIVWCSAIFLDFFKVFFFDENLGTYFLYAIAFFGETGFHVLTCADRYLAVVHPVKYQALRASRGASVRNVGIVWVWTTSFPLNCLCNLFLPDVFLVVFFVFLVVSILEVSFCSLSVLFALIRPGAGVKVHLDPSKQRPFFTVAAITAVLSLFFLAFLVSSAVMVSHVLCDNIAMAIHSSLMWLSLPSSLVLPLLHLHKTLKRGAR